MSFPKPDPFLIVRVHDLSVEPSVTGLCVGYERKVWRTTGLANHVMDWLPEFSLTATECDTLGHQNATKMMRSAAKRVYDSKKFKNRGEFGEVILHAAIRQVFDSLPAVSKIYYKSSNNDTVKGFDAVHIVGPPEDLELWLGEVKFYSSIANAIHDVIPELKAHLESDFLRNEFALIINKIDPKWPHSNILKKLLQPEISLDQIFKRVCIPVLLTYDSPCIADHTACNQSYTTAFEAEIRKNLQSFILGNFTEEVRIHIFLLPLLSKTALVTALDEKLKAWQQI